MHYAPDNFVPRLMDDDVLMGASTSVNAAMIPVIFYEPNLYKHSAIRTVSSSVSYVISLRASVDEGGVTNGHNEM